MPDHPTPGEVAYEAWADAMAAHAPWGQPSFAALTPAPDVQHAWEAAAQAVLAQEDRRLKSQEDSLTLLGEARPFFEDAFAGVLEGIELRPRRDMLTVVALVASSETEQLDRCLRVFDETWWLANCHRSHGRLVFDYETVARRQEETP